MAKFKDQQVVWLKREFTLEDGSRLAAGSVGTIVRVYPDGIAYDVKFTDVRNIQTVTAEDIDQPD